MRQTDLFQEILNNLEISCRHLQPWKTSATQGSFLSQKSEGRAHERVALMFGWGIHNVENVHDSGLPS
jgi:hypothetical protein